MFHHAPPGLPEAHIKEMRVLVIMIIFGGIFNLIRSELLLMIRKQYAHSTYTNEGSTDDSGISNSSV